MLPQINQRAQGNNVQLPQVPSTQQSRANMSSQATPAMGARPFSGMAPDNGQHGGAPRYQTATSGAAQQSVSQAMPSPYPRSATPPAASQGVSQAIPQLEQMREQPQPAENPAGRPAMFDPQRVVQTAQQMQNAMPFNKALQERFLNQYGQRQQQQAPQVPPSQQPLPPMFNR